MVFAIFEYIKNLFSRKIGRIDAKWIARLVRVVLIQSSDFPAPEGDGITSSDSPPSVLYPKASPIEK